VLRALAKGAAIGFLADEGDHSGPQLAGELRHSLGATREVAHAQITGTGSRAVGRVGDADPERKQVELLRRIEETRCEPCRMKQAPKVVAGVGEVGVGGVREASGIDATEDDGQRGGEDVRNGGGRRRVGS
jgi:hypothetical protein